VSTRLYARTGSAAAATALIAAAVAAGFLAASKPTLLIAIALLAGVAALTWVWPHCVPGILLAGPGFLHLLTSAAAGGGDRSAVLSSPLAFLPVLLVMFGPPVLRGASLSGTSSRRLALVPGAAGRWLIVGMALLALLLVLRFPGTPAPIYGITKIIGFAAYSFFPVLLVFIAFRDEHDAESILDALLIIGAAWLTLSLVLAIRQSGFDLRSADPGQLLGGANESGGGLGDRAVPVALVALASAGRASRFGISRLLLGAIAIVVLLLSAHRGAILAFGGGLAMLLALNYSRIRASQVIWSVAGLLMLLSAGWFAYQHAPPDVRGRYVDPFASQSVQDRLALQRAAIQGFFDSPLIGAGTGSSAFLATASDQTSFGVVNGIYPHNVTVELLAELGILGAGTYFVTIGGTMWRAGRRRRTQLPDSWALVAALSCSTASFVASQAGADLTIQNDLWIMLSILAIAATVPMRSGSTEETAMRTVTT
jgi:hypothetical protein